MQKSLHIGPDSKHYSNHGISVKDLNGKIGFKSREGVIIKWPLNDLFNDGRDVIISSQMAVIIIF